MKTGQLIPWAFSCALLINLIFPSGTRADVPLLRRDEAISLALGQNPELKVAAHEIDTARARLHWAGLLPNPELEIGASDDFLGKAEGERTLEVAFTQRFPVTSALRNTRELRRQQVEIARLEFAARRHQLAHEVDKAWVKLAIASRTTALRKDLLALNDEIVAFLEKRSAAGEASLLDAAQAKLESRLISQQIAVADARTRSAAARLQQLAGLPAGSRPTTGPAPELPPKPPSISLDIEIILSRRPDHKALLLQPAAGTARLALANARRWEDVGLTVFYEAERSIDEPEGAGTNHFAGLSLSIPLPFRKQNGGEVAEAEVAISRAKAAANALAFTIRSELDAALEARATAYRLATEASGDLLSDARRFLEKTTEASRSGQASFLQVRQAREQLIELETASVQLLEDFLMAEADVRFAAADYPVDLPDGESSPPSPDR